MANERIKHRWWVIALVTLAGVVITGAPFALSWRINQSTYGTYGTLLAATLTNIGTSLVLLALLYFAERGFTSRVTAAASQAAKAQVEESTQDLRTRQDELATAVSALREAFAARTRATDAELDTAYENLQANASFETVTALLENANTYQALLRGTVKVPLTQDRYTEQVEFSWAPGVDERGYETSYPELTLSYSWGERGYDSVEWQQGMSALDVMEVLRRNLIGNGQAEMAKQLPGDVLTHLGVACRDAVAGWRHDDGAWCKGRMVEWLRDGWAVTTEGLISRDHGVVVSTDAFPRQAGPAINRVNQPAFSPQCPPDVDPDFWAFAVDRAKQTHPINSPGPYSIAWDEAVSSAYTKQTSPLRRHPES